MQATENILEFPGFVDVHVHFRDPGVPEAETTESGLEAARRGGFGAVVTMPNTMPPIDTPESVKAHQSSPSPTPTPSPTPLLLTSACITKGRLGREVADLEAMAQAGAAFFTDDGTYVNDTKVMEEAMCRAKALDYVVCQHALAPHVTEAEAIARDLSLCRVTGCRLHIQHISTAAGVDLVRAAQQEGLPVTAEATPHHILLCQDDIVNAHPNYKMAPPLMTREDRDAVRQGVLDGVLMFATDHAPHPAAKKCCDWARAANGIIGLEVAIPITYHVMVEELGMDVNRWAEAWWKMPLEILAPAVKPVALKPTRLRIGALRTVDVSTFASKSRNCPYDGMRFTCWPVGV